MEDFSDRIVEVLRGIMGTGSAPTGSRTGGNGKNGNSSNSDPAQASRVSATVVDVTAATIYDAAYRTFDTLFAVQRSESKTFTRPQVEAVVESHVGPVIKEHLCAALSKQTVTMIRWQVGVGVFIAGTVIGLGSAVLANLP